MNDYGRLQRAMRAAEKAARAFLDQEGAFVGCESDDDSVHLAKARRRIERAVAREKESIAQQAIRHGMRIVERGD